MKKIITAIAFLTVFVSCKNTPNPYIDGDTVFCNPDDAPTYSLSGEPIKHDVLMAEMYIVEDYLFFYNMTGDGDLFSLYGLDGGDIIASFGTKGQGPGDFTVISMANCSGVENGDVYTWINDINALKFKRLNISKSIMEEKSVIEKELPSLPLIHNGYYSSDSLLVLKRFDNTNMYITKYDPLLMEKTGDVTMYKPNKNAPNDYMSVDKYDKTNGLYASAMFYINQVNFIDANTGKGHAVCVGELTTEENLKESDITNKKIYYIGLVQSDKYFFALYRNTSFFNPDAPYQPSEIHVFDKNGYLEGVIKVKESLAQIAVDKYDRLYGADDNTNVYRYKLPEELS